MFELPTSIMMGGKEYAIRSKGDYRVILDCFKALQDENLSEYERIIAALVIFYEDVTSVEAVGEIFDDTDKAVTEMYKFFNYGELDTLGVKTNYNLIDWDKDQQIIASAINKVAGKEIRLEPYVHWWTFMGYYLGIDEGVLSNVVSIRNKMVTGKKLEKYERDFQKENPQYFKWNYKTLQQKEDDKLLQELWTFNS